MEVTNYRVKVIFNETLLGTQPQRDIAEEYLQSKAVTAREEKGEPTASDAELEAELETLDELREKGTTAFHKLTNEDGTQTPVLVDYQIKGFLKHAGGVLNGIKGVKNLKSKVTQRIFVRPRYLPIHRADGKAYLLVPEGLEVTGDTLGTLSRPLRRDLGLMGPRTAIATSEEIPAGSYVECKLVVLKSELKEEVVNELFKYGQFEGLGQWRSGGHGSFDYELTNVGDEEI